MAECGQCGREAIVQLPGGQLLCAYCWSVVQQNNLAAMHAGMAMINYYGDLMADMVGLPRTGPHIRIPTPTILQGGPINLGTINNIRVERGSQVGQINAGAIVTIDRAVSIFNKGGQAELAQALQGFTQAVLDNNEIGRDAQKQVLDSLQYLITETEKQATARNKSVFRTVLDSIQTVVGTFGTLAELWRSLRHLFENLVGPF